MARFLFSLQRSRGRDEMHHKVHAQLHEGEAEGALQLTLYRHQHGHQGTLPGRPISRR